MWGVYNRALRGKLDVSLNRNRAFLRPVNAVHVWAILVKANPPHDGCSRVQLGSRGVVYPDALSPLWHTCKIGLAPGESLKQGGSPTYGPGRHLVLQPNAEVYGFAPQVLW